MFIDAALKEKGRQGESNTGSSSERGVHDQWMDSGDNMENQHGHSITSDSRSNSAGNPSQRQTIIVGDAHRDSNIGGSTGRGAGGNNTENLCGATSNSLNTSSLGGCYVGGFPVIAVPPQPTMTKEKFLRNMPRISPLDNANRMSTQEEMHMFNDFMEWRNSYDTTWGGVGGGFGMRRQMMDSMPNALGTSNQAARIDRGSLIW